MLSKEETSAIDNELNKSDYKPSVYRASYFDPDKQAEIIKLSESRKIPMGTVERNLPKVKAQEKAESVNLDGYPKVSSYMADDRNSRVSIDDLDNLKGLETTVDDMEHGFLSNAGRGALDRVNQLTGNFLEIYGSAEEGLTKALNYLNIPNPGVSFGDDGISWNWDVQAGGKSAIGEIGKAVSDQPAYGYESRYSWEKFKGELTAENLAGFVLEQGVKSIPDMLAAVAVLPAYIASRTEEIAEARVKNDERKEVGGMDLLTSLPVAVGTALLEKVGAKFVFGAGKAGGIKDVGKAIGSGAAVEGGTEFAQEGVEYLGETLGTKKKLSLGEMFDRQLAGLVAGGGMGGTIKGATSSIEAAGSMVSKNVSLGAQSMAEQETIDNLVSFSQSSTTRGRMADRFKNFMGSLNSKKQVFISNEAISEAVQMGIELPSYVTDQLTGPLTDITMSVDNFTTDIAGNEDLMGVIREHIKLNPHTLTQAEAKEPVNPALQSIIEKAGKEKQELTEAEEIYNDVKDQIVSTERQTELTAKFSAALIPKWVAGQARRAKKSVKEVYDTMGLKVESDKVSPTIEKTASGNLYEQDFGDIMIKEKVISPDGKPGTFEKPAQREWDVSVKRRKQAIKLRNCINA
jgi:hypothetical protein